MATRLTPPTDEDDRAFAATGERVVTTSVSNKLAMLLEIRARASGNSIDAEYRRALSGWVSGDTAATVSDDWPGY